LNIKKRKCKTKIPIPDEITTIANEYYVQFPKKIKYFLMFTFFPWNSCVSRKNIYRFLDSNRNAKSIMDLVDEFTEYATIQGLVYIFSKSITMFGKLFWFLSICSMISLGMYWTVVMYAGWQGQQVLIVVTPLRLINKFYNPIQQRFSNWGSRPFLRSPNIF